MPQVNEIHPHTVRQANGSVGSLTTNQIII